VRVGGCCCGVPFGCSLVLLIGAAGASLWRLAGPEWAAGVAAVLFAGTVAVGCAAAGADGPHVK
jgi:hypothetical protein